MIHTALYTWFVLEYLLYFHSEILKELLYRMYVIESVPDLTKTSRSWSLIGIINSINSSSIFYILLCNRKLSFVLSVVICSIFSQKINNSVKETIHLIAIFFGEAIL